MEPLTTHKDQKPGRETDPKPENIYWYFIKCKEGEELDVPIGSIVQLPKSHLEHKVTWLPCDGQLVKRSDYPELEAMIHASGSDNYFQGDMIQIPNLNGVYNA